jgi:hypothetical protein
MYHFLAGEKIVAPWYKQGEKRTLSLLGTGKVTALMSKMVVNQTLDSGKLPIN